MTPVVNETRFAYKMTGFFHIANGITGSIARRSTLTNNANDPSPTIMREYCKTTDGRMTDHLRQAKIK